MKQNTLPQTAEFTAAVQNFVAVLGAAQVADYLATHHKGVALDSLEDIYKGLCLNATSVHSHVGKTWVRIDIGTSGRYMVNSLGMIYGIKAYGVPNLVRHYGALNTLNFWDWRGYYASFRQPGSVGTPEFVAA